MEPTLENPFLEKYYTYGRFCGLARTAFLNLAGVRLARRREPKKYALPMQLWLLKQRFVTYISAVRSVLTGELGTPGVILDRSVS